jgi:hypothetical protein
MPALRFFAFTRDLLAMLVRDALAELEQRAATRIIGHLSLVAARVSEAWKAKYRVTRTERIERRAAGRGTITEQVVTYSFANKEESKALYTALTQAVEQRVAYEQLLQRNALVRRGVRYIREGAQRSREQGRSSDRSDRKLSSELDLKEQELQQLEDRSASLYRGMQQLIGLNSPLGLLALEGLTPGFTQARMEDLLGATLWELYASIDVLGAGIDPRRSQAAALLANAGKGRAFPADGPEATVVDAAVMGLPRNPAWFALLHGPTLNLLVESEEIPRDSFTFVVFGHYVMALEERLEAERQAAETSKKFWRAFSMAAAAVSLLLLLVTPPVAAAARGAVLIIDLVALAHAVSSVTQQLARLDELRDQQLLHPDAFSVEGLGHLGELGVFRRELMANISQQLLKELIFIALGAQWGLVKKLLMFRGYLQDIETLDFGED